MLSDTSLLLSALTQRASETSGVWNRIIADSRSVLSDTSLLLSALTQRDTKLDISQQDVS